jgi:hypothetical protein
MKRLLLVAVALLLTSPALAEPQTATFALIIGVNRGADRELPVLRYADDDAARYQELFRVLGARTHLLARMDANTRRLHAQAAAEASIPRRAELERTLKLLSAEIQKAKKRGVSTTLYVVYAGHGNVKGGEAYVLLEDDRLNAKRLAELVQRPGADRVHLIVDACHSGLLAASRGPGGKRRPLSGFSQSGALVDNPKVGLLLSTSSGRESHEWEGFQAGVFSHEIRSGLYGAADANRDGRVSYREIAAFVARANEAIPNERFRPEVYARPPSGSEQLANVERALERRIEIRSKLGAHWVLENSLGVRIADFHPKSEHETRIARSGSDLLFLRRLAARGVVEEEYAIPAANDVVTLAELVSAPPRVAMRGAAHESFSLIFSLPFSETTVTSYRSRPLASEPASRPAPEPAHTAEPSWRHPAAITLLGLAGAAAATGGALWLSGETIRSDGEAGVSQRDIAERNERVSDRRLGAYVAFGVAGAAAAAGITLLVWPSDSGAELRANASSQGISLRYRPPLSW